MDIPKWIGEYYPDVNEQEPSVQQAYSKIKQSWDSLSMINISSKKEPHTSYYIHYYYDLVRQFLNDISQENYQKIKLKFNKIIESDVNNLSNSMPYAVRWLNDMAWIMGDKDTIESNAYRYLNSNYYNNTGLPYEYFDLIQLNENDVVEAEVFPLIFNIYSYLTDYGKKYHDEILEMVVKQIKQFELKKNYIYELLEHDKRIFNRFTGVPGIEALGLNIDLSYTMLIFNMNNNSHEKLNLLVRKAENEFRNHMNIPEVGKGWLSETVLFENLRKSFPNLTVKQHAMPNFLGRQHYDIYFPEYKIAIEYHGKQHFEPVDYFGGEVAFQANVKRDQKKAHLSKDNGVKLFVVQEGYDYSELVQKIVSYIDIKYRKTIDPITHIFDKNLELSHREKISNYKEINIQIINRLTPLQAEKYQRLISKDLSILKNFTRKFQFELTNYKKFSLTSEYIEGNTKLFLDIFQKDKKNNGFNETFANMKKQLSSVEVSDFRINAHYNELIEDWYTPASKMFEALIKYYDKVGKIQKALELIKLYRVTFANIHPLDYLEKGQQEWIKEKEDKLHLKINIGINNTIIIEKHLKQFISFEKQIKLLRENNYITPFENSISFLQNVLKLLKIRSEYFMVLNLSSFHASEIFQTLTEFFILLLDKSYSNDINLKFKNEKSNFNKQVQRQNLRLYISQIIHRLLIDALKVKDFKGAYKIAKFGKEYELYFYGQISYEERLIKIKEFIEEKNN
ncbi:hypothetical protein P7G58_00985 [Globicatella sulfidifaciens]|uniref:hypothetical protein n=1 Tax=Globicatella sulfidifaciens TaxID=136093 RepID=UPI0028905916|nr:hypothetical protein [Globicatella sulfidifaciens]MDT2767442.1 hypothetical protein [Globicatella sulfidifaciens]